MITDKDFSFRCCWTCDHCILDLDLGYICTDKGDKPLGGNEEIHKNRDNCRAYKRG